MEALRGGAGHRAWALQVLDSDGERITSLTMVLDVETLFPAFGLRWRS